MTPLLYKKTGTNMALALVGEKIDRNRSPVRKLKIVHFLTVIFQVPT
ncbi:hypothetical protein KS918_29080 (plasmid) [Klebsiella pneumoniae]|nr:hypothetical protein [Klebsiella pneumoniae]